MIATDNDPAGRKGANEILSSLGKMYGGGGDFTTNIDKVGGEGTAQFACDAIQIYCR